MTTAATYVVECSVLICARRQTVFRYFTDSKRFADWWGAGSRIEPRPGGEVRIVYPGGVIAVGQVLELAPEERVVFTYGYEDQQSIRPIPAGGSRVTIRLEETPAGTLVSLSHEVETAAARDAHVSGWRYQLALFANVAAGEEHAQAAERIDRYFAVWNQSDAESRRRTLAEMATEDVVFQDSFGCVRGAEDLNGHIGACQQHMPGMTLAREGEPRHCQGTALADWTARGGDGSVRARGTNVFRLAPDGRIAAVVGFWAA